MLFLNKKQKEDINIREKLIKEIDFVLINSPFRDKMLNQFRDNINLFSTKELETIKSYIFSLDKQVIMNYLIEKQNEYEELIFNLNKFSQDKKRLEVKTKESLEMKTNKKDAQELIINFS